MAVEYQEIMFLSLLFCAVLWLLTKDNPSGSSLYLLDRDNVLNGFI